MQEIAVGRGYPWMLYFRTIWGCPLDILKTFSGNIFANIGLKDTVKDVSL